MLRIPPNRSDLKLPIPGEQNCLDNRKSLKNSFLPVYTERFLQKHIRAGLVQIFAQQSIKQG